MRAKRRSTRLGKDLLPGHQRPDLRTPGGFHRTREIRRMAPPAGERGGAVCPFLLHLGRFLADRDEREDLRPAHSHGRLLAVPGAALAPPTRCGVTLRVASRPRPAEGTLYSSWSYRMALIDDETAAQLKEEFAKLVNPVRLLVFSQALADPESEQVRRLVEEMAALDPKLSAESYNFVLDKEKAGSLGIARIPAVAILGADKDHGIRFYGMPSGYEFGSLVDAILDVSSGDSGLLADTKQALQDLARPVHIQV